MDIWIKTNELANIQGVTKQAVFKNQQKFQARYVPGRGRGGRVLEFLLSSLPEDVQKQYCSIHNIPLPNEDSSSGDLTGKQRKKAAFKLGLVRKYLHSGMKVAEFVRQFNLQHEEKISDWQLRDWTKRYKCVGHDMEIFVDRRGENRSGSETIPQEAWKFFLELILTPQKRSVSACYDKVKQQYPNIPGVKTFERRYADIPDIVKSKAAGQKDKFSLDLPSLHRDYTGLHSNEIWCLDHHRSDVFVRIVSGGKTVKVVRLWMTCILDVCSRKIMSMVISDKYPSKLTIKRGLREAIEKYGVPEMIQTDNGKDYLSKDLDPKDELSMLAQLGIEKSTAQPYHGQSKPVERFFRTLEENFGKFCYGYGGNDCKNRPDYLRKTEKELKNDTNIQDSGTFIAECMNWIEKIYACKPHGGNGMNGKSPDFVYAEKLENVRHFDNANKLALICGEHTDRVVRQGGIQLLGRVYRPRNAMLTNYTGQSVNVVYLPSDIDHAYVYDKEFRYICSVTATLLTPFRSSTMDDYKAVRKEQKAAKKLIREQMPKARLSVPDMLVQKQLEELNDVSENIPAPYNSNDIVVTSRYPRKKNSFEYYADETEKEEVN